MLTPDEQREIMRQDRQRRRQAEQREAIELWLAQNPPTNGVVKYADGFTHANAELVRGIGAICPPHVSKASRDSWTTGRNARSTTVGVADPNNPSSVPTMRVTYADGTTEIKEISRRPRRTAPQVVKVRSHAINAADLPAIGDQNH